MNKIKTILFSVMILLMVLSVNVFAAEPSLEVTGELEAKPEESKTLTIKILSEDNMGVFSGKIVGDGNISNLQVSGKNGWNMLAYENGSFKLVKSQGGKNEEAMDITYTIAKQAAGKATITLSNIDLTTIDYNSSSVADITKEISIKTETPIVALTDLKITKAPNKIKYTVDEVFVKDGMEVTATYSDNSTKHITNYTYSPEGKLKESDKEIVVTYTENGITKTATQAITVEKKAPTNTNTTNTNTTNTNTTNTTNTNTNINNTTNNNTVKNTVAQNTTITIGQQQKDNTVANKELSKAGSEDLVFFVTMAVTVLGSIFYIKYNRMKDIK